MNKILWQILWFIMLMAFTSIIYFLSLFINCPIIIILILTVIFGIFTYKWLNKNIQSSDINAIDKRTQILYYIVLIAGIAIVINKIYYAQTQFGEWDSWWLWNYHARFLTHENIKYISHQTKITHPDYPLMLPGMIALFWQLFHTQNLIIPYIIGLFVTIIIPVILYLDLYKKNFLIAGLVLLLIATDDIYLRFGLMQYADIPLGLFFLCAFVCVQYAKENTTFITLTAIFLGCCIWTKNEGIMLSLIFTLFHAKTLFTNNRWKHFIAGFAIPLAILIGYKYAMPATDLIKEQNHKTLTQFLDWNRYKLIWQYLWDNINGDFFYIKIGTILYGIICFVEKKMPDKNILILLCCLIAVFFVFVFTTKTLQWHLETSMDRVLAQLMPAFVYVIAIQLSKLKLYLSDKQG